MELELKNKVAIVTGGGWGIGKAAAMGFADEGAKVVIADLDEARGNSTVQELKAKGSEALFARVDVSSWPDVEQAVASTLIEFFTRQPREDWAVQIEVCYYGTLNFTKAVIDHMVSRETGSIINIGSDAARVGEPNQPVYAGAKAAVVGFSKSLAKEVGRHGIRVNVVCPSLTTVERRVEMEEQMKREEPEKYATHEEQMKKAVRLYPMRKFGKPADVANMIVFLGSDLRSGHVTGQTISVNGGYCMV